MFGTRTFAWIFAALLTLGATAGAAMAADSSDSGAHRTLMSAPHR